jgi:endopeptidase Clp ATP-binding regulatory subunit ClpX
VSPDNEGSPLEDLQNFLNDFKDKYEGNVEIDSDFSENPPGDEPTQDEPNWEPSFDYTPLEIKDHLDEYVIGQNQAKKHLANAVCYHYRQIDRDDPFYKKKNILMIGNTGVGKTHLVEVLSQYIGVPFVKADATKFSGTGYVGKNVNSLVRELTEKADENLKKAEHGIVFVDEIDKICSSDDSDRDVSGQDVQTNLLKLLEETEVNLMDPSSPMSMMKGMQGMLGGGVQGRDKVNTGKILFIVSGAFPGLEDIIDERLSRGGIGFNADVSQERDLDLLRECSVEDLVNYGLESEFVGRLPVRTYLADLDRKDLYRILTESRSSILEQYKRDFQSYDVDLTFTEDALRKIAEKATEHDIGARGLTTVLEETLFEFMHQLPEWDAQSLTVDEELVQFPQRILYEMILDHELDDFVEELTRDRIPVDVTDSGRDALVEGALEQKKSPMEIFRERFDSLDHILKMVDCDSVEIDDYFVNNPEEELDRICSDHYQD